MNILLRITKIAFKYKIRVFAAWLTLILSTLAQITIPWLLGTTIDQAILGAGNTELITLGVLVLVFMGVRGIMQYVNMYLAELVSQKVAYEFRNSLYDKLQRLSFAFHDRAHTGDLMSRATVDVEAVRMFIGMVLVGGLLVKAQLVPLGEKDMLAQGQELDIEIGCLSRRIRALNHLY